jgi:hypothetical protein
MPLPSLCELLAGEPVTVVAAFHCADHLLVAADSEVTGEGFRITGRKLDFLPAPPLAWGFSGAEDVGVAFRRWLQTRSWTDAPSWAAFQTEAVEVLTTLNGNKRRSMRRAGAPRTLPNALAAVLIAGYLGREPEILEIDGEGRVTPSITQGRSIGAIGTGAFHTWVAYQTLQHFSRDGLPLTERPVYNFMQFVAGIAPLCNPPIRLLKVTPSGVVDVTPDAGGPENR